MKKTVPFTIATENKIPRNRVNEIANGLYTANYKTLLKDTEEDTKKWTDIPPTFVGWNN